MTPGNSKLNEVTVWPALADYWHPVAYAHEVTDKPLPVKLLGEDIVVCRLGDTISVFSDLCIHRGTPISMGWIENGEIVCAYHGWSYNAGWTLHPNSIHTTRAPHPEEGLSDPLPGGRAVRRRLGLPIGESAGTHSGIPGV